MAAFVLGTSMRRAGGRDCPSPSDAAMEAPRSQAAASHRHGIRVRRRSAPSRWPCPAPASEPTSPMREEKAPGRSSRTHVMAGEAATSRAPRQAGKARLGGRPSRTLELGRRRGEERVGAAGRGDAEQGTRSRGRGRTCLEGGSVRPSLVVGRPCVPIAARTPAHTRDTAA